ncbi:MAG: hypothetical protein H6667_23275 [Ardenticatenaceae bacterium]|nr:hypothetical protein [Ardenticatenaceae bacterium]MCB9445596.1 hypothetical protein [Ardenticatenaceae bacterium]
MILLNFGHPLTGEQLDAIQKVALQDVYDVRHIKTHFDHERPFPEQIVEMINGLPIDTQTWQTKPILINPPTLNVIALTLIAELHGRMGYFPAVIRLKPVPGSLPPQFEFAEIINLQAIRDQARTTR